MAFSVIDLALVVSVIHVGTVFELLRLDFQLPLHAVVCKGEWGWRLLARSSEEELFRGNIIPRPHVLIHQLYPDVDIAGEIVSLDVEVERLLLRGRVELDPVLLAVAVEISAGIGLDHDRVVLAGLESLDGQHHAVVALIQGWIHHSCDAVPDHFVIGELAVLVVVVVEVVVLTVAVRIVSVLANPTVTVLSAVVVGVVFVLHLVLHPVVRQSERGWWLFARSVKLEMVIDLNVHSMERRQYLGVAGEVVCLHVERERHVLRGRIELVEVEDYVARHSHLRVHLDVE